MALHVQQTQQLTSATSAGGLLTATTILAANKGRTFFMIQNQDTNPLYIAFGVTASSSVYHRVLAGGTGAHDGTGGSISMESGTILGMSITCYSSGTPSYTVLETSDN
jgi:hypothetical protein